MCCSRSVSFIWANNFWGESSAHACYHCFYSYVSLLYLGEIHSATLFDHGLYDTHIFGNAIYTKLQHLSANQVLSWWDSFMICINLNWNSVQIVLNYWGHNIENKTTGWLFPLSSLHQFKFFIYMYRYSYMTLDKSSWSRQSTDCIIFILIFVFYNWLLEAIRVEVMFPFIAFHSLLLVFIRHAWYLY